MAGAGSESPKLATARAVPGRYATFTVNGEPFFAWVGFGAGVTDGGSARPRSRRTRSMSVDDAWEPVPPEQMTPAYVIAGGVTQPGDDWRLEFRPSQENVRFSLVRGSALSDFTVPSAVIEWAATDPVFGAITKQAAAVEFRRKDGPSVADRGNDRASATEHARSTSICSSSRAPAGIDGEAVAARPDGEADRG